MALYRLAEDGKKLIPEPKEQAIIKQARKLRRKGLTIRAVGEKLTKLGLLSRVGRSFGSKQVWEMVGEGNLIKINGREE